MRTAVSRTERSAKVKRAFWNLTGLAVMLPKCLRADSTWEYAVQASAAVQISPPQIRLSWVQDSIATPLSYTLYRKAPSDNSWGTGTVLPGTATGFVDANVTIGTTYEYQIHKTASTYQGYGYLYAGINVPLVDNRGKVILIVDNTYASDLSSELVRLQQDLAGDGWTVIRHEVSRTASVPNVKALIQSDYNADPASVRCVFLFGHVPVPYSGNISPDEHIPDHQGAWPADVFYGDMDGVWTDSSVYTTTANDPRNRNVPGDGKFDQSFIPSNVELMVGRVDLANLPGKQTWNGSPTFPSEVELLRQYLNKDHNFRLAIISAPARGLIHDSFGDYGGYAFSASGWRNFAPFFGPQNITYLPNDGTWLPTLSANAYLWAYGCGPGQYTSISGLGNTSPYYQATTTDLVAADIRAVFTMLFGSWLGDWDSEDDFQRAALATPTYTLVCVWSGSPHWFCQHMALGETIGFSTRLTQNNGPAGLYQTQTNTYAGQVHIALMGDPTLRMHPFAPPSGLSGITNDSGVVLNWPAAAGSVLGYHVYRATNAAGPFARLTTSLLTNNSFTDSTASSQIYTYMVRAVRLETTPSGTYNNPSQGAFVTLTGIAPAVHLGVTVNSIVLNPAGIVLTWTSAPQKVYRVACNSNLLTTNWIDFNPDVTATASSLSWTDLTAHAVSQRFYRVFQVR